MPVWKFVLFPGGASGVEEESGQLVARWFCYGRGGVQPVAWARALGRAGAEGRAVVRIQGRAGVQPLARGISRGVAGVSDGVARGVSLGRAGAAPGRVHFRSGLFQRLNVEEVEA